MSESVADTSKPLEEEETDAEKNPKAIDQLTSVIGEKGKWQLQRIAIVFLVSIPGLSHIFVSPFSMPKNDFVCQEENGVNLTKNECSESCYTYQHDLSFWHQTVISEFDLVCQRSYLPTLSKMLFFGGFGAGTFAAGIVSDIFGRKKSIIMFSILLLAAGVACSLAPNYPVFVILYVIVGMAGIANFTVAFVWVMELASGKWKILLGMGMQLTWPISRISILILAYLLRNWRTIMQVISAPMVVAPLALYFLPESPRWLIAKGRLEEAKNLMVEAAKCNSLEVEADNIQLKQPQQTRKGTLADVMKYPTLRKKTLIMFMNWFSSSFMLYGLALNWQNLTGDLWITFLAASCLDFPAKVSAIFSLLYYGRKMPYVSLSFLAGVLFIIILCIPRSQGMLIVVLSLVASFCVSSSFAMLWMWMGELMPTQVRNAGVGSSSLVARIGGVMATTMGALADISPRLPIALFATVSLTSAFLSLMLPETQGKQLPDTAEQSEKEPLLNPKDGLVTMLAHVKTARKG